MERLTYYDDGVLLKRNSIKGRAEAILRLSEYEDTGLTPGRIMEQDIEIDNLCAALATAEAQRDAAIKDRDAIKNSAYPVCPSCELENDRIIKSSTCDRCGATLYRYRGAGTEESK